MPDRRSFLRRSLGLALGASAVLPAASRAHAAPRFGPLRPDPKRILDLPEGFTYEILQTVGDAMTDGHRVPGAPDGMACMSTRDGKWALMRNHELSIGSSAGPYAPGQVPSTKAFDRAAVGGVTRVVIDPRTRKVLSSNLVLVGTVRNCAGGPSPWGWLSCEEDVSEGHGYVFLCDPDAATVADPVRIRGYGRFNHEAAAVDPATNVAYLTEDRGDSALYRFVPADRGKPFDGELQALKVVGRGRVDTSTGMKVGDRLAVEWVPIAQPDPRGDTVRGEAQGKGAALFSRGEGIWWANGAVYVCSTDGGPARGGQIFELVPTATGGTLTLIAQSTDRRLLDMPDNITVAPNGDLYMAEDGGGDQFVRVLGRDGAIVDFARNAKSGSELAGVCFSPDGTALFVNIQRDGLTLMVTGPFDPVQPGDAGSDAGGDDAGEVRDASSEPDAAGPDADTTDVTATDADTTDVTAADVTATDGTADPVRTDAAEDARVNESSRDGGAIDGDPGVAEGPTAAANDADGGCGCTVPGAPSTRGSLVAATFAVGAAFVRRLLAEDR